MLVQVYQNLKDNIFIKIIRKFMDSNWMMFLIILLAGVSNIFGLEIPIYYCYTLLVALAVLFCDDLLSLFPIACCSYMTFSKNNNPLSKEQTSIFLTNNAITHMFVIGIIVAIFVLFRVIFDIITNKERRKTPKLLYGFLALGLAYIFGGLFSGYYNVKTAFFGLVEILTLSFTYFCFYYTVDWKRVSKNYYAILFTMIGFLMVAEVFNMLIEGGLFETSGKFNRNNLFTGWGHYNNVAAVCVLCIPAPFYFSCTKKNGWLFSIIGTIFLLFTILTQSRNGMLMGTITYLICVLVVLIKTKGIEKIKNLTIFSVILLMVITVMGEFNDEIRNIFSSIYKVGTNDSGRIKIYKDGLKQFFEFPIFGNGFYECKAYRWGIPYNGDFLPPRYHDTYVQILASCGVVGIIAYIYHRISTIKLFFKKNSLGNIFIGISILGFLLISIFDCHFHNLGPGFLYSALLLLSEKLYNEKEDRT